MHPSFKRFCSRSLVALFFLILGYFALHFWQTRGWQKSCGTYLVGGGETYVTITGTAGWLTTQGNVNVHPLGLYNLPDIRLTASFENGCLFLNQGSFTYEDARSGMGGSWVKMKISSSTEITLRPSSTQPGDWDLETAETAINKRIV